MGKLGNNKLKNLWREGLILRDIGFLQDCVEARKESRLYLLHDLCPVSDDQADNRKLGHLTVAYAKDGKKRFHTVSVYLALSSTGEVQDGQLRRIFDHFQLLCDIIEDAVLCEASPAFFPFFGGKRRRPNEEGEFCI